MNKLRELTISELSTEVEHFVKERKWEKYHNPKDLAEGICIEASELLEIFLWRDPKEASELIDDPIKFKEVEEEVADVMIYCLSLANSIQIDLTKAILHKLELNKKKYPAEEYCGKARL